MSNLSRREFLERSMMAAAAASMPAAASADRTRRSRLSSKAVSGIMLPSSISPGKEISGLPSSSARSLASWGEHRAGLLAQHVGIGARLRRLEAEQQPGLA